MDTTTPAGRAPVTLANGTRRAVCVVVYRRSALRPGEPPVVWLAASVAARGKVSFVLPRELEVFARYSFEPENPRRPVHQTNSLQVRQPQVGAGFEVQGLSSPDRRTWGAVLARSAESPGWFQLRVVNQFQVGVWAHVRQDGRDVFPPRVLPPLSTWLQDLDAPFRVAVLAEPRKPGDLLVSSANATTETAVTAGESLKIQGGPCRGFRVSRVPPRTGEAASRTEASLIRLR